MYSATLPSSIKKSNSIYVRPTPLHINEDDTEIEIDIFSAEKYFNDSPKSPPSTLSETNSTSQTTANSRNALLPHLCGPRPRPRPRPRPKMFLLRLLCCSSCAPPKQAKDESESTVTVIEQKQQSPVRWREEDDRSSESSSDLFEIQSVGLTPAAYYEPSEASIAWSVLTASAANVSVLSDRTGEIRRGISRSRRRSSGLLQIGCASHKAVEVRSPVAPVEVGSSISPLVARYHVDLEVGRASARILPGRASGTSWQGGSARNIV